MNFITNSVEETIEFGKKLATYLKERACICLDGDLGAGKTHLTKGIALGLGITEDITSPTFTIVQEYEGNLNLYHFDMYRLADIDELYAIGFEDYLRSNQIMIIEWSQNVKDALPNDRIEIFIEYTDIPNQRKFNLKTFGNNSQEILKKLNADIIHYKHIEK